MFSILLQAGQTSNSAWGQVVLMAAIIGIFYFFMIRPQQKKQKDQKKFVEEVKKGDLVVTIGGAHGRIADIEGDTVILEFERGARIRFSKSAISMDNTRSVQAAVKKTE